MKRSQVRWLAHLLTKSGTLTLPQGKTHPRRTYRASMSTASRSHMARCHCFGQTSNSMKASGPETRRANENKTFYFRFPIQCHCLLVSRFVNYFYHEKMQRTFSSTFLLLSTESSAFSNNSFPFSH